MVYLTYSPQDDTYFWMYWVSYLFIELLLLTVLEGSPCIYFRLHILFCLFCFVVEWIGCTVENDLHIDYILDRNNFLLFYFIF